MNSHAIWSQVLCVHSSSHEQLATLLGRHCG